MKSSSEAKLSVFEIWNMNRCISNERVCCQEQGGDAHGIWLVQIATRRRARAHTRDAMTQAHASSNGCITLFRWGRHVRSNHFKGAHRRFYRLNVMQGEREWGIIWILPR